VRDVCESCANTVTDNLSARDGHVVETDEATTDLGWSDLCNIERHDHGGGTDTKAYHQAADGHLRNAVGSGLKDGSYSEQSATDVDGDFAPKLLWGQYASPRGGEIHEAYLVSR
jgi:hypothetical protein